MEDTMPPVLPADLRALHDGALVVWAKRVAQPRHAFPNQVCDHAIDGAVHGQYQERTLKANSFAMAP
jgi:hypothetical protein